MPAVIPAQSSIPANPLRLTLMPESMARFVILYPGFNVFA